MAHFFFGPAPELWIVFGLLPPPQDLRFGQGRPDWRQIATKIELGLSSAGCSWRSDAYKTLKLGADHRPAGQGGGTGQTRTRHKPDTDMTRRSWLSPFLRATSLRVHGDAKTGMDGARRRGTGSAAGDSLLADGEDEALLLAVVVVVAALIVAPHLLRLIESVLEMRLDQPGEICFEEW